MYVYNYIYRYVYIYVYVYTYIYIYIERESALMRGWRNAVGNLIELCWPKQAITALNLLAYA